MAPPPRPGRKPGPIGVTTGTRSDGATPFLIHLNLNELVKLESVQESATKARIRPGEVFSEDPARPKRILERVRDLFSGLTKEIRFELGNGSGAQRYLKARFSWLSPEDAKKMKDPTVGSSEIGGVSAQGITRSKVDVFSLANGETDVGVTGYIFEGVITLWVEEHLLTTDPTLSQAAVDNLFAVFIVHETGHQLGLAHSTVPNDVMFIYSERPLTDQKRWMELASQGKLRPDSSQVDKVRLLLGKP